MMPDFQHPPINPRRQRATPVVETSGELLTEQHHAETMNVAALAEAYLAGDRPAVPFREPVYGDDRGPKSLQEMLDVIDQKVRNYEMLPLAVRRASGFDPNRYEQMLGNPEQREKLLSLGLDTTPAPEPESPDPEPSVPSEPTTEPAAQPAE